jgi:23S rRNA (uracil1939-C5)-methyltransferase
VETLAAAVHTACGEGAVLDLYAGVGLFGVTLAAAGRRVTAVEGHGAAAADLRANAAPLGDAIDVHNMPVERFLSQGGRPAPDAVIIDPPRTGMTADALRGVLALGAGRLVFVSCDVATFARDLRRCLDAGYALGAIEAFDLFPNTAHVEVLAQLARR